MDTAVNLVKFEDFVKQRFINYYLWVFNISEQYREDIIQDFFIYLVERNFLENYDETRMRFSSYMIRHLRNFLITWRNKYSKYLIYEYEKCVEFEEGCHWDIDEEQDLGLLVDLREFRNTLKKTDQIIWDALLVGYSLEEIGKVADTSGCDVWYKVKRIKKQLREYLCVSPF